jgi:hypothetical protein
MPIQRNYLLIAASDRMITAGDIEFEQEQRKIHGLTSSVSVMIAGDLSIQTDILLEVADKVEARVAAEPQNWWKVKDVADLFYERLSALKQRRAKEAILDPLGLDFDKLTSPAVAPELAEQLAKEVLNFQIPRIEALVIGIDTRAHIYEVNNDGVTCQDWTGFSSIGAGAWHANSQLMVAGHVKSRTMAETLMLVYTAKRRAEVAPGVGEQTDMIVIGPQLGSTTAVGLEVMNELRDAYGRIRAEADRVRTDANAKISEYIEKSLREAAIQRQTIPAIEAQSAPEESTEPEFSGKEST